MAAEKGAGPKRPRTRAQRTGDAGEEYAAWWLRERGYRILARNWHSPFGEVDIIAAKGEIVAFVEVKARRPGAMVSPLEAVTPEKRRKLLMTSYAWLRDARCPLQPRMDVAAVTAVTKGDAVEICGFDYYEGAFDGSCYHG